MCSELAVRAAAAVASSAAKAVHQDHKEPVPPRADRRAEPGDQTTTSRAGVRRVRLDEEPRQQPSPAS
jgi:hypothetical protein